MTRSKTKATKAVSTRARKGSKTLTIADEPTDGGLGWWDERGWRLVEAGKFDKSRPWMPRGAKTEEAGTQLSAEMRDVYKLPARVLMARYTTIVAWCIEHGVRSVGGVVTSGAVMAHGVSIASHGVLESFHIPKEGRDEKKRHLRLIDGITLTPCVLVDDMVETGGTIEAGVARLIAERGINLSDIRAVITFDACHPLVTTKDHPLFKPPPGGTPLLGKLRAQRRHLILCRPTTGTAPAGW